MITLSCPLSGNRLELMSRPSFERVLNEPAVPLRTTDRDLGDSRFESADSFMVDTTSGWGYPVIAGIPIMLVPERFGAEASKFSLSVRSGMYDEAYAEMEHYNRVAEGEAETVLESQSFDIVSPLLNLPREASAFPERSGGWIDAVFDCVPQYEAYKYVRPVEGDSFLQLGGKGTHAVKFLIAGCSTAHVISPMFGEALFTRALAEECGFGDHVFPVVALGEELPFEDGDFDLVYSGGSLHHTDTQRSIPEVARVLRSGGRFSSVDMWDAPLYSQLISLFGKREQGIECKPLDDDRMSKLSTSFTSHGLAQHGTLSRYAVFAFQRAGLKIDLDRVWAITQADDKISSKVPGLRQKGSAVVTTAMK